MLEQTKPGVVTIDEFAKIFRISKGSAYAMSNGKKSQRFGLEIECWCRSQQSNGCSAATLEWRGT